MNTEQIRSTICAAIERLEGEVAESTKRLDLSTLYSRRMWIAIIATWICFFGVLLIDDQLIDIALMFLQLFVYLPLTIYNGRKSIKILEK